MFLAVSLKFYKKKEVMDALCEQAKNKEVGPMFGIGKFGKRPDMLVYPNDVLEFAKKRASSFHCSEELWQDPLSLSSDLKRKQLDSLRIGWDFILDIDCPVWEFSKLTTHLFIEVLKAHNIKGVTCKFSGNKGFHIAVPFESFPEIVLFEGKERKTKNLFPELPRILAEYVLDYVETEFIKIKDNNVTFIDKTYSFEELKEMFNMTFQELTYKKCLNCGRAQKEKKEKKKLYEFLCDKCGNTEKTEKLIQFMKCSRCNSIMRKQELNSNSDINCACGNKDFIQRLALSKIIEVDTILIASRHMYRMPYSLHEKSKLVSIPIKTEDVLDFDKKNAEPENVNFDIFFLNRNVEKGEAQVFVTKALEIDAKKKRQQELMTQTKEFSSDKNFDDFEIDQDAVPVEMFPPCIMNCSRGLEDGRKRILFALTNFLVNMNWTKDKISEYVHKWNEQNLEPLRETLVKGQLNYRTQKNKILPPNCDTAGYYKDLQLCTPDGLCSRIKNPVQYSKVKNKLNKKKPRKKAVKKSDTNIDNKSDEKNIDNKSVDKKTHKESNNTDKKTN